MQNVESGKTILGPINTGEFTMEAVCYSPDTKMIATCAVRSGLKIWNANSDELLKTFKGRFSCLAWSSDGKMFIAGGSKINTATWTDKNHVHFIAVSPNDRILATTSFIEKTVKLWDLETNQTIGTLHHRGCADSATFSVDGKFLVTYCDQKHIYTWDVSAIVKEAGLPSDIVSIDIFHFRGH
jgi:WD40 repeat protein